MTMQIFGIAYFFSHPTCACDCDESERSTLISITLAVCITLQQHSRVRRELVLRISQNIATGPIHEPCAECSPLSVFLSSWVIQIDHRCSASTISSTVHPLQSCIHVCINKKSGFGCDTGIPYIPDRPIHLLLTITECFSFSFSFFTSFSPRHLGAETNTIMDSLSGVAPIVGVVALAAAVLHGKKKKEFPSFFSLPSSSSFPFRSSLRSITTTLAPRLVDSHASVPCSE